MNYGWALYAVSIISRSIRVRPDAIKIWSILGTPSKTDWSDGYRLADRRGYTFPKLKGKGLRKLITNAWSEALDFMMSTLQYDPKNRPTASELLQHPFFKNYTITKDVYYYTRSKNKKKDSELKSNEIESLKISPNGITIEKDSVDNSPLLYNKLKEATGMISGFDLRKSEKNMPKLMHKPSYKEQESDKEMKRQPSIIDQGVLRQSVLLK